MARRSSFSNTGGNGHDVDGILAMMTDDVVMEGLVRKGAVGQPHQQAMMARRQAS
jgi:hypothetical protein